ncbi:spermidine/putrescine transport system permease protein [Clostridium acidisoli DSM 12555]|uniref:Spermidine/putrescine transport system permease protein n=1 Tax=Clostridium acidisoli DSM 12555 TaxID=1121291 RepID=A0A1W1XX69_9CLOT|nr:ABC transporter permease [Clostridium acidisoli]SMC28526.1 spermidine/putrescine transport system permease protein [Clostridium acidisoli DSM 12555]
MVEKYLKRIYLALTYVFLYAPIVFLIIFSFNSEKFSSKWGHFSLQWYTSLFNDDRILTALYYTVLVAVISSVISTIFGTISAIGINKMKGLGKKTILNITNIPVLNPDIVTAVSLMTLFIFFNIPFGLVTLILAHIAFSVPYVILSVLPKLRQLPEDIVKASLDLGATPGYTMRKVILPQIKPGIIAGFLFAFTMSIDDFVISFFNTGSNVTNLSIEIYSMARRGISPEINALSTLMFVTILILLLLANGKDLIGKGKKNEEY